MGDKQGKVVDIFRKVVDKSGKVVDIFENPKVFHAKKMTHFVGSTFSISALPGRNPVFRFQQIQPALINNSILPGTYGLP